LRKVLLLLFLALCCHEHADAEDNMDQFHEIVRHFLPPEADLIKPNQPEGARSIQCYDFDQDGQLEIVATYRLKEHVKKLHLLVLKRENQQWRKVYEKADDGFDVEFSGLIDLTGDGRKEYIVGWGIGASAGSKLEVFSWKDNTLQSILEPQYYHQLEILRTGRSAGLAIWERYCCDAFIVDVLTWDGRQLTTDEELYQEYYPKVERFYKDKIKGMDAWFYWYALADAQLKANYLDKAKESIQRGLAYTHGKEEFHVLKRRLEDKLLSTKKPIQ
jgi:hypothetical protein